MRVYQGALTKGDFIVNTLQPARRSRCRGSCACTPNEMNDIEPRAAGDIVALFGVDCTSGDTFTDGTVNFTMTSMHVPDAVISLAVAPKDKATAANFSKALNRFTKEDPTFRVHRDEESAQTIIGGMGELHLEIYIERMKREYNAEVVAGQAAGRLPRDDQPARPSSTTPTRSRPVARASTARSRATSSRCPRMHSTGFEFVDDIVGGSIPREFIPACEKGFKEAIKKGPLIGFPVVGVRACVNDGASHPVDSSEIAFRTASLMGFREAYAAAKPTILEPIMKVEVQFPEEFQGAVWARSTSAAASSSRTEKPEGYVLAMAEVPLNDMFGYSTDLRSATQGKGEFTMEFQKYAEVPKQQREVMMAEFRNKKEKESGAAR